VFPSTACILQAKLGARGGPAFDVQAVCSGFVYALAIADRMIAGGLARNALVVGAEIYSRILDWNDRGTCVLFGDGAGAVVLVPSAEPGILSSHLHADGHYKDILCVPGQVNQGGVAGTPFVHMDGHAVFKFAVKVLADVAEEALAANGKTARDIDWLIPHQANIRIMDATAKRLGVSTERVISTVDAHANTSAASIPLALDVAVRDGRIRGGENLMLLGVGGGFTWGSVFVKWRT
jgi:3-oxoacyl-[acyl-carrier-protein] synthase III